MNQTVKGMIFDLDGTLIASYEAIYLGFEYAYEKMGVPPLSIEEVKRVVGSGLTHTFRDLLGEERVSEALRLFREKYEEVFREHTYLLPDAREVLQALHGKGVKLGIATNKLGRFSREIFRHFRMDHFFTVILGDEDVPENKPHPGIIYRALQGMALKKEEVFFIGDSPIDIQTGHNAGVAILAIPTGVTKREDLEKAGPTMILDRLTDLLKYV